MKKTIAAGIICVVAGIIIICLGISSLGFNKDKLLDQDKHEWYQIFHIDNGFSIGLD